MRCGTDQCPTIPPRVKYDLTDLGRSVVSLMEGIKRRWPVVRLLGEELFDPRHVALAPGPHVLGDPGHDDVALHSHDDRRGYGVTLWVLGPSVLSALFGLVSGCVVNRTCVR
ncbi:hypothetical protein BH24ACT6_BH24ACT6_18070 [soil metagenome]